MNVSDIPEDQYTKFAADFPFEETPDQLQAIENVFKDLSNDKPMDWVICGDVTGPKMLPLEAPGEGHGRRLAEPPGGRAHVTKMNDFAQKSPGRQHDRAADQGAAIGERHV